MTKKTVSRDPRIIDLTLVQEWQDGRVRRFQDYLVGEEPLEISVGTWFAARHFAMEVRTRGHMASSFTALLFRIRFIDL